MLVLGELTHSSSFGKVNLIPLIRSCAEKSSLAPFAQSFRAELAKHATSQHETQGHSATRPSSLMRIAIAIFDTPNCSASDGKTFPPNRLAEASVCALAKG